MLTHHFAVGNEVLVSADPPGGGGNVLAGLGVGVGAGAGFEVGVGWGTDVGVGVAVDMPGVDFFPPATGSAPGKAI